MKKKMVFGLVFCALFVLQVQSVFAQRFEVDFRNGGFIQDRSGRITDRVNQIGVQVDDRGMVIIIDFKDGSSQTYAFTEIGEVDQRGTFSFINGRKINLSTSERSGNFNVHCVTGTNNGRDSFSLLSPIMKIILLFRQVVLRYYVDKQSKR
jgi:hypothetical protein